jgi:hypothetical protein
MKKIIAIFLVLFCTIPIWNLKALDTLSIKYFPMHVGDFWIYNFHRQTNYGTIDEVRIMRILDTAHLNNHIYYVISGIPDIESYPSSDIMRTDSISGSLRKYDFGNSCIYYYQEILFDSLAALNQNEVRNCSPYSGFICSGSNNITIFGINSVKKDFGYSSIYDAGNKSFVKGIGLITFTASLHAPGGIYGYKSIILKGCRINGIVYGDTSLTLIRELKNEIPSYYNLFQNYPNPFNPNTSIRYQVSSIKIIKLVVYDLLGKEVEVLVNENQKPGTYEVSWDGSNYPSGMYFYRLTAGDFSETKKMVLVK